MSEETDVLASIANAKAFLRCGGVITWDDWKGMDTESRAVLSEASEELDAERAALVGLAMTGVRGVSRVLSKVDGGDSLVRTSMLEAVGRAVERMT